MPVIIKSKNCIGLIVRILYILTQYITDTLPSLLMPLQAFLACFKYQYCHFDMIKITSKPKKNERQSKVTVATLSVFCQCNKLDQNQTIDCA